MKYIFFFLFFSLTNSTFSQVTDIDGNTYKTKIFGKKLWMIENLRVTRFNNGDSIQLVLSNDKWVSLNSPGYCFYNNNIGSVNSYGLLYNGYVLDSNICPVGWHIPNEKEWIALAQEFDKIYSLNKLDTSRVKKLQGHRRGLNGQYYTFEGNSLFEGNGPWWCSSNSEAIGWNRFLDYVHISYRNESYRECGNSIRCVKD